MNDFVCQCEMAGYCSVHGILKGAREHQICIGQDVSAFLRDRYVEKWNRNPVVNVTNYEKKKIKHDKNKTAVPPCIHRGDLLRVGVCNLCGIRGMPFDVFKCAVHGECSHTKRHSQTKSCMGCSDRLHSQKKVYKFGLDRIKHELITKHLLFHLLPVSGGSEWVWRKHVQHLKRVQHNFNGRKIISVVTSDPLRKWSLEPFSKIESELSGCGFEFIKVANKRIGECVSFPKMLAMIESDDPNQVFFYGHSKGATRGLERSSSAHDWTDLLWETVGHSGWEAIDQLSFHPVSGSFISTDLSWTSRKRTAEWYYAGTFFWGRSAAVFANQSWKRVPNCYGGVELWPGSLFPQSSAGVLFNPPQGNLYDRGFIDNVVLPQYNQWKEQRISKSLAVITPCSRPWNLHVIAKSLLPVLRPLDRWIIVYDGKKVMHPDFQFGGDSRVIEVVEDGTGRHGNRQRNRGLDLIGNCSYVYFLDDDNLFMAELRDEIDLLEIGQWMTFDQIVRNGVVRSGNNCRVNKIDTAQGVFCASQIRGMKWSEEYNADGLFFEKVQDRFGQYRVYRQKVLAYYNQLSR